MRTLVLASRRTPAPALWCLPLLLAACGASADRGTGPAPVPTPAISVGGPTATALTAEPGGSATTTIAVTRAGGFGGTVDLSAADLPPGVTATLAPSSLAAGATQSTITTVVGADVAPGSYAFTVTGRGAGVREVRVTVPVTVARAASPAPTIALSGPAGLAVARGSAATAAYTLARSAYAGDVALSAEGLPPGVTATFAPATLSGGATAAVLTLDAAAGAAVGPHAITVRARGAGVGDATAAASLVVEPAPAPAGALDGIYLGFRTNFEGRQYQDYWTFRPDGRVVRSDPYEGLDRPVDMALMCRRFACGTYTRSGAELRIRWAEGADERVYDVDSAGAFNERGKSQKYRPLAPLTGLRLDATFAELNAGGDSALVRIRLTADGRFVEESLMHYTAWAQLGAPGEDRVELPGGAGRYTIARNTLALAYDAGRTAYFTVVVPPGEIGKPVPDVIYVNQARIARAP